MNIDNIEIKIKKWNKKNGKNEVIVNLIILESIEIRGYIVRYTPTKYSAYPVWVVTPPSVKGRNKIWFHIVRFQDTHLWEITEKNIIDSVKREYERNI